MTGLCYILLIFCEGYLIDRVASRQSTFGSCFLLGAGCSGLLTFFGLGLVPGRIGAALFLAHVMVLVLGTIAVVCRDKPLIVPMRWSWFEWLGAVVLVVLALQAPYGKWDGWVVWNTKAKFLAAGGEAWTRVFSPHVAGGHTDYPLLLPSLIAGGWILLGDQTPWIPIFISVGSAVACLSTLFHGLKDCTNSMWARLGALLLFSSPTFLNWSWSQYADVLLSAYLITALQVAFAAKTNSDWVLSGFLFGVFVFIKNEALIYFLIFIVSWGVSCRLTKKSAGLSMAHGLCGFVPGLTALILIRFLAPSGGHLRNGFGILLSSKGLERFFVILRFQISEIFSWQHWAFFWPLAILLLCVTNTVRSNRFSTYFLLLFAAGSALFHMSVYMLTYHDLRWLMAYSYDRLLLQIMPSIIFLLILRVASFWGGCRGSHEFVREEPEISNSLPL